MPAGVAEALQDGRPGRGVVCEREGALQRFLRSLEVPGLAQEPALPGQDGQVRLAVAERGRGLPGVVKVGAPLLPFARPADHARACQREGDEVAVHAARGRDVDGPFDAGPLAVQPVAVRAVPGGRRGVRARRPFQRGPSLVAGEGLVCQFAGVVVQQVMQAVTGMAALVRLQRLDELRVDEEPEVAFHLAGVSPGHGAGDPGGQVRSGPDAEQAECCLQIFGQVPVAHRERRPDGKVAEFEQVQPVPLVAQLGGEPLQRPFRPRGQPCPGDRQRERQPAAQGDDPAR